MIRLFYFSKKQPADKLYFDFLQHDNPWLCFSGYDILNSVKVPRKYNAENHNLLYKTVCMFLSVNDRTRKKGNIL